MNPICKVPKMLAFCSWCLYSCPWPRPKNLARYFLIKPKTQHLSLSLRFYIANITSRLCPARFIISRCKYLHNVRAIFAIRTSRRRIGLKKRNIFRRLTDQKPDKLPSIEGDNRSCWTDHKQH